MKPTVILILLLFVQLVFGQQPVPMGEGSYASYVPLSESQSSLHGGCQAYQMEHRRIYLPDSLLQRLGQPNGTKAGTITLPSNDWWTHALVNTWTGKLWCYPGWVEANENGLQMGYPTYWEPTGCEVKWDTPLTFTFINNVTGNKANFQEALVDNWSDFMLSFIMQDGEQWVRVTCMQGSPLVWIEADGITVTASNPNQSLFAVLSKIDNQRSITVVAWLTQGLTVNDIQPYAWRIPRRTIADYQVNKSQATLDTYFRVYTQEALTSKPVTTDSCLMAFLPHHYYSEEPLSPSTQTNITSTNNQYLQASYLSPRGKMRLMKGNHFAFRYPTAGMLPFFPAPREWKDGYSSQRMSQLVTDYVQKGSFGADTYWGGKGLTQMMHYMTFALQMGDETLFHQARKRLKEVLINWYTYTPGEQNMYFARYPKWGAMVGFDPSYDSDTFNDHHFHYGYFIYASAVLCMLDADFKNHYGAIIREVALDYASWLRDESRYPRFRTFNPYCGHSFAGGMGNAGNGNGQESSSEAMQGWGGIYMLGAALEDEEMMDAGIYGYTLEAKATEEYWFDRKRRNIDYTKYQHPYCCNLTMQGVGWWTWFSGDPVWMHSIQWLPISPVLTNYFSYNLPFAQWDYAQMYAKKEVGNYEAASGGLGDESGLGNVCLSYLSLFDADSAARVWDRMDQMGKALAKNPDTGGITYWLTHSHRSLGEKRFDIHSSHPLACAYTDTLTNITTYAMYNATSAPVTVRFFGQKDTSLIAVANALTLVSDNGNAPIIYTAPIEQEQVFAKDSMAWELPYPNLALHKPVEASSFENAGTQPISLTDGDYSTRWGSKHNDNEYAIVDLQENCYIDHLVLRWETAYATRFTISLSTDKQTWKAVTLTSSGGIQQVALAQAFAQNNMQARGRYIRIVGVERATTYGTSLYELEAYGRPMQSTEGTLFAMDIQAQDNVLLQSQSTTITVKGYDAQGNEIDITNAYTLTTAGVEATIQGNTLTANQYGTIEVTAVVGTIAASTTIVVLETEQATQAIVTPQEVTLPIGESVVFEYSIVNQFGASTESISVPFIATQEGDTTILFQGLGMDATAIVHVIAYTDYNLALGKKVEASGSESDATKPAAAVDGKLDTRWSSRFQDNEWIAVDLGNCYRIHTLTLRWEAAYATEYQIQVSDDGIHYNTIQTITNAKGGVQNIDLRSNLQSIPARYVRIVCLKRNTGYGSSLWEIEVYGDGPCDAQTTDVETTYTNPTTTRKVIINHQLYIIHPSGIYNAQGRKVNDNK